jgi:tripartite-type tricarboxylate transporter receptor subunit TctC
MSFIRTLAFGLACVMAVAAPIGPAAAQADAASYPNRTVRLIVPFPPGGPADVIARFVGQKLSEQWGQTVVIENRPGGNTAIAAQQVARSAPDGYTLLIPMDTTMVLNPLTLPNLPYDPVKDFIPISMLTKNMSLVVTRMAGPKSIQELIARAKAKPGTMNMGAGTITSRLGAVLFAKTAGIDVQLVPFKGSAEIGQAVLAGTVDFALDSTGTALPLIRGGQYRALAKYTRQPLPWFPDLPSLGDAAGLPTIDESSTWIAIAAPAGTPRPIVDKIEKAVARIYADRPTMQKLQNVGINAVNSTSAELSAYMRSESVRWAKVLKENAHLLKLD